MNNSKRNVLAVFFLSSIIFFNYSIFASDSAPKENIIVKTPQCALKMIEGEVCFFQNGVVYPAYEKQEKHEVFDLEGVWKKERVSVDHDLSLLERTVENIKLLEKESAKRFEKDFDDSSWVEFKVPGIENPPPDRYQDGAWYRRKLNVPVTFKDKKIFFRCEGANYVADVWVNGKWVGSHEGGYTPFVIDVSAHIFFTQENTISIRVDNIPWIPHKKMTPEDEKVNKKNIVPYKTCDWWNYGGITRDIYLEAVPEIYIPRADVKFVEDEEGNKKARAVIWVQNNSSMPVSFDAVSSILPTKITEENILDMFAGSICDFSAHPPVDKKTFTVDLKPGEIKPLIWEFPVENLKRWSASSPNLYVLNISLKKKDEVIENFYTQFGYREVEVDNDNCKLLINEKQVFLRGVARHEVYPGASGGEKYDGIRGIYEDLLIIKKINSDFLRTAHYPNHPSTYILTDRVGFSAWEEIPVFWFDGPQFDLQRENRKITTQMWLEMIVRDLNRPSILFWSTCNECTAEDKDERIAFFKDLKKHMLTLDGSRLFVQSAVGNDVKDITHKECDLIGITCYYGIFYGKDYFSDTLRAMNKYHKLFPSMPILITEFGIWSEQDLSNAFNQMEVASDTFSAYKKCDFVCGTAWWTAFNWHTMITEPQTMGLVTWDRKYFKPVFFTLQRIYGDLLEDFSFILQGPEYFKKLESTIYFEGEIKGERSVFNAVLDDGQDIPVSFDENKFSWNIDTKEIEDGMHNVIVKSKSKKGVHYWDYYSFHVENSDDPPKIKTDLKDGDHISEFTNIIAYVEDDFELENVVLHDVRFGKDEPFKDIGFGVYSATFDASLYETGQSVEVIIKAFDEWGNRAEKKLNLIVDKTPGVSVELPMNHDWIADEKNMRDANDFYNFPAEFFPSSDKWFIHNGKKRVKFYFPSKETDELNNMECKGQVVEVKKGQYTNIRVLGVMHNTSMINKVMLVYVDGTKKKENLALSDWWTGNTHFGEEVAVKCTYHHEVGSKKKPPVGVYVSTIKCDPALMLRSIQFPVNAKLHIFAVTLEKN